MKSDAHSGRDGPRSSERGPHQGQRVATAGRSPEDADAAVILVHGRGATAESILGLALELDRPDLAWLAPQAANNTWYPYSFLSPIEQNQPGLSSGLAVLEGLLDRLAGSGIPADRTVIMGFSQGACLSTEYVARNARRYGGAVGLSGGLIGPKDTPRAYPGALEGTPVFLGCSDRDPHIPHWRVEETEEVLTALGAEVTTRIYPGMGHTVNRDELDVVSDMLSSVSAA